MQNWKQGGLVADRYVVKKKEGKTDPEAFYYPLRLDTDIHAVRAAIHYANSVRDHNKQLATDIIEKLRELSHVISWFTSSKGKSYWKLMEEANAVPSEDEHNGAGQSVGGL